MSHKQEDYLEFTGITYVHGFSSFIWLQKNLFVPAQTYWSHLHDQVWEPEIVVSCKPFLITLTLINMPLTAPEILLCKMKRWKRSSFLNSLHFDFLENPADFHLCIGWIEQKTNLPPPPKNPNQKTYRHEYSRRSRHGRVGQGARHRGRHRLSLSVV